MSTFPRRGKTHILEDRARRFFIESIPSSWVVHEPRQGADYGTDFIIDLPSSDGLFRGASIRVQLKGTARASIDQGILRCRLPVRHLRYLLVRPEPALLVLYIDERRALYFAWLDHYRPHNGCGNDHPWWQCTRPVAPLGTVKFEIDCNDRVDSKDFEDNIQEGLYIRQEILFCHHIFWPTVDPLIDDYNPRRFRNFARAPDFAQYLEVSIIPRHSGRTSCALEILKDRLDGPPEIVKPDMLQWRPGIAEAFKSRAQVWKDGSCCLAWTRRPEFSSHIEMSNLLDLLKQLFTFWRAGIEAGIKCYVEVAGLRVQQIPIRWFETDFTLRRFYFFVGTEKSSDCSDSAFEDGLAAAFVRQLAAFTEEGKRCLHHQILL